MQETELSSPATAAEAHGGTRQRSSFGALVAVGLSAALTLTLGASFFLLLPQEDISDARAAFIPEFHDGETLATETSHLGQAEDETGLRVIARQGPHTLLDPVVNVRLGIAYLSKLTDRYQNVSTALTAYNWGPAESIRRLRAGKSLPTLYRDRVMQAYDTTKQAIGVGRS